MRLTPLDIREQQFRRVMRGLDPEEVEQFMATVASEFEALVASNNELRQLVVELEEKVVEYKSMEKALRDALLAAERVMGEAKESAQREAALIVREAELAADRAKGRLSHDLVRLQEEIADLRRMKDGYLSRVRWLLRSHLEMLDGHGQEFVDMDASLAALSPSRPPPPPPVERPEPNRQQRIPPSSMEWSQDDRNPPGGLEEVLRPVNPDGNYGRGELGARSRPLTAEEIADAARRAERLAAEAREALERHAGRGGERRPQHELDEDSGPFSG
jgi:cell division initiation protein